MSEETTLLGELKRRNIFRVVTVYALTSWVILQIADIGFPAIDLPEENIRYVFLVLLGGFPLMVAFAWFFELTPDGLKRSHRVPEEVSNTQVTARRIDRILIAMLSIALLFFMVEYFNPGTETSVDPVAPLLESPANNAQEVVEDTRPSLAVLPLVNMSSDQENEHFSDGLTEEMLNVLAQNQSLKVAGRTSSFFYKGKNANLKDIGEALEVEHIVEGSVRKSGNQVRITVQLINALTGFHLWSKTFDEELTDIFAVQDTISKEVADALEVTLLEMTKHPGLQTEMPAAYELYLQGREALYARTLESIRLSIGYFEEAMALDPNFISPILGYAEAVMVGQSNNGIYGLYEAQEMAAQALQRVEQLGFDGADYWAVKGLFYEHGAAYDSALAPAAEAAFQRALELNENDVRAYIWYATLFASGLMPENEVDSRNKQEQSHQLLLKARSLDPLNRVVNSNYYRSLLRRGQYVLAEDGLRSLIQRDAEAEFYPALLADLYLSRWEITKAAKVVSDNRQHIERLGRQISQILSAIVELEDDIFQQFLNAKDEAQPDYKYVEVLRFVAHATPPELKARAELMLLQPETDQVIFPVTARLYEAGEYETALELFRMEFPEFKQENPVKSARVGGSLPEYAKFLAMAGRHEDARRFAEAGLRFYREIPRTGFGGKRIADAFCYMVLNRREEAVTEIVAATAEGFRGRNWLDDPLFAPIIDDPRIQNVSAQLDAFIEQHREPVMNELTLAGVLASSSVR